MNMWLYLKYMFQEVLLKLGILLQSLGVSVFTVSFIMGVGQSRDAMWQFFWRENNYYVVLNVLLKYCMFLISLLNHSVCDYAYEAIIRSVVETNCFRVLRDCPLNISFLREASEKHFARVYSFDLENV